MGKNTLYAIEWALLFILFLSSLFFAITPQYVKTIVDIQLFIYILLLYVNYRSNTSFNLYQIWIAAYIFIVWAEMEIIAANSFTDSYITPFVRFSLANCAFMIGYHCYHRKGFLNSKIYNISTRNNLFVFVILVLYVYFIASKIVYSADVFFNGRSYGSGSALGTGSLLGSLTGSAGMLTPALIGYYYVHIKGKSRWSAFVYSLPIFVILLLTTSRFKLLFSILPFLIVTDILDLKKTTLRKNVVLLLFMIAVIVITGFSKMNRNVAFAEVEASELFSFEDKGKDLFESAAYQMSPEGVVMMASIADNYFSSHSLHYGKETGFLFYFWVPRGWWPNKPTMLDNWLIREYENVSEGFSSASGFIGELRADFGWFCLFFVFLFGLLIRKLDNYTQYIIYNFPKSYNIVLISTLFPWVFFVVRSPITATMTLFWEFVIWKILSITSSKTNK